MLFVALLGLVACVWVVFSVIGAVCRRLIVVGLLLLLIVLKFKGCIGFRFLLLVYYGLFCCGSVLGLVCVCFMVCWSVIVVVC